jgi:dTDP-L-rhamnose 4-epimerase
VSGRVLVTGGAGFIGSHVVDELVAAGYRVRSLDSLHRLAHRGEPDYLNPEAECVWADLRDPDATRRALDGTDAVSHQAAMVGLGADFADIADYVADNALGTATLLRAMHEAGFGARLVLAGSMVVYGEGRYRCPGHGVVAPEPRTPDRMSLGGFEPPCPRCGAELVPEPVAEDAPTDPRNVYAATKLHQEHLCRAFARETGTALAILRYHNVYGPRMPRDTPYAGVASIFRSALEAGRPPRVFEDGHQLRDFISVADVARANRLALEASADVSGPFNIASGTPRTVGELASELARATGGPEPLVTGEFRLGDVRHVFASAVRARERLGFEARVGLADGVAEFARAPLREAVARAG